MVEPVGIHFGLPGLSLTGNTHCVRVVQKCHRSLCSLPWHFCEPAWLATLHHLQQFFSPQRPQIWSAVSVG
jgi:hypothetical protein